MSLSQSRANATLPVQDLTRARAFFEEKLGLSGAREEEGGIFFDVGEGTTVLIFPSQGAPSGDHTQIGWNVADIDAEVAELKSRGVVFEEYDFPALKTVDGIAETPAGKAAWFKDSEGNVHGVVQLTA
jgi:catechol 2,3-dioxygenase-like lactoylglutathione lyase family enzyme